jgi:hypothetical protein
MNERRKFTRPNLNKTGPKRQLGAKTLVSPTEAARRGHHQENVMLSITRKLALLAVLGITSAGAIYAPTATAGVSVAVGINVAPPAPQYEVVPPPRAGYVWAPGYWRWEGHRHVWVGGTWIASRPGYVYHPTRWEHAHDGWRMHEGYWGH